MAGRVDGGVRRQRWLASCALVAVSFMDCAAQAWFWRVELEHDAAGDC